MMTTNARDNKINDQMLIDASATKEFFISILVRDIDLAEAIVDLVDNAVDGARNMRSDVDDFKKMFVHIEINDKKFSITDNCGGIDVEVARLYAFRFGRRSDYHSTNHSVGQFGVGMKRAIFKLGDNIKITSQTKISDFEIAFHVDVWKKQPEWDLKFSKLEENLHIPPENTGTKIEVTDLNSSTASEFMLPTFNIKLKNLIESAHMESLLKGLEIKINNHSISASQPTLLNSSELFPLCTALTYFKESANPVTARIYAGISDSNPSDAGWNIICNGRAILSGEQTNITGWGEGTPRFHNQYSRFRGYVFLDSDDASLLPWNTTKTGVDAELPLYKSVLLEMINAMKPVLDFLNKLDRENDTDSKPLTDMIHKSKPCQLVHLVTSHTFKYSMKTETPINRLARIQYQKPLEEVDRVKAILKVSTLKDVGEKTFEYFLNMEG